MNCKIESMNENRKNHVDTLPPRGRVNEVRREWLVHEDGALAYRLQDEEIKQHLTGNKSRNTQIREDFPRAKDEQLKEAEEAARLHHQILLQQEQQDAKIAAQLAQYIEKEEEERKKILEEEDKELAKLLQEKEQLKISKGERDVRELETHTPRKEKYSYYDDRKSQIPQRCGFKLNNPNNEYSDNAFCSQGHPHFSENLSDINKVGLPLNDEIVQPLRNCHLNSGSGYKSKDPSVSITEDEARRIQEEKDEEYARYLQEKEDLENLDSVNRDRLLAIETQDKELARLLQEKERAKARRARERAKQKAALKRMQEENFTGMGVESDNVTIKTAETVPVNCHRRSEDSLTSSDLSSVPPEVVSRNIKPKPRYPDPDEIVEVPTERSSSPVLNIAMTIDPTYTRESLEKNPRHNKNSIKSNKSLDDNESNLAELSDIDVTENAPPYMPIQGQRRFFEKKSKQRDGCKQQ